jgi:hypothetical protein
MGPWVWIPHLSQLETTPQAEVYRYTKKKDTVGTALLAFMIVIAAVSVVYFIYKEWTDWRTSGGLPSASDPETEADRTPRESLLACMTANCEPRLREFAPTRPGR